MTGMAGVKQWINIPFAIHDAKGKGIIAQYVFELTYSGVIQCMVTAKVRQPEFFIFT
jgi:hypothetical protein